MIAKLIAQDARTTAPKLALAIGVIVVTVVINALVYVYNPSGRTGFTTALIGMLVVTAAGVFCGIYLIYHYWQTMHGRYAYFTHSLPVTGGQLFAAKVLWATFASMIVSAVCLVGVLSCFGAMVQITANQSSGTPGPDLSVIITEAFTNAHVLGVSGIVFLTLVYSSVIGVATWFGAITIGASRGLKRFGAGGPVMMVIGVFFVQFVVSLFMAFFLPSVMLTGNGIVVIDQFALVGDVLSSTPTTTLNGSVTTSANGFDITQFLVQSVITVCVWIGAVFCLNRRLYLT